MRLKRLLILTFTLYSCGDLPESECLSEVSKSITAIIAKEFQTEDVIIQTKRLQEEIYLPKIDAVVITISDATLRKIDFKENPTINNYEEFESYLKSESRFIESKLLSDCNFNDFDEIIIEFGKRNSNAEFIHWFVIHFKINTSN
jgi:hypothetical protein